MKNLVDAATGFANAWDSFIVERCKLCSCAIGEEEDDDMSLKLCGFCKKSPEAKRRGFLKSKVPAHSSNRNSASTRSSSNNSAKSRKKPNSALVGISAAEASREIGSRDIIRHCIKNGTLPASKVGRLLIIPVEDWERWKASRSEPPSGFVPLRSIKDILAIKSDKLSEFARMGYVPTAILCNGIGGPSSQFGTWYIERRVADELVADRRAGRTMPWHGKPLRDNLRITFKLWDKRRHPAECATCRDIWGKGGAPESFDDFILRYPPLAHGAKRHLTLPYTPGLTVKEVAIKAKCSSSRVQQAIDSGLLASIKLGTTHYISRTDATRWETRKCPTGENITSWITLSKAEKLYFFSEAELRAYIQSNKLKTKPGQAVTGHGELLVSRSQCAHLRETIGYTEEQAASKVGVTLEHFRVLLEGVDWREAPKIPLVTVQAVIKRLKSREGYTINEAAEKLGTTREWVLARKDDGTIKLQQVKWESSRLYISEPMFKRLQAALKDGQTKAEKPGVEWLPVTQAAAEAGVSADTIVRWAENKEIEQQCFAFGWRYKRESVRARARRYWITTKPARAVPPSWMNAELRA